MSFEDSNSFLFGLNHFTSPSANGGSSSLNEGNNQHSNQHNDRDNGNSTNLLEGLGAFGGPVGSGSNGNDIEGGSFAEQLALWTNANFSFDGPTGHALLGDEEKDKDGKDKEDDEDQADSDRRAGKRSRNNKKNDDVPNNDRPPVPARNPSNAGSGKRNGKNRLRDENDQSSLPQTPAEPSNHHRSRSNSNVPTPFGGNQQNPNNFPYGANPPFNLGQNGVPPTSQPANNGSLDLTSLLALQQLLTHNPLAMATLGNFGALNPQLSALSSQLGSLGNNLNNPVLQQIQQQIQQQQQAQQQQHQQQAQHNRGPQQQNGVLPVSAPAGFPGAAGFPGWGFPANGPQLPNGHQTPFNGLPNGMNGNFNGVHSANQMQHTNSHSATSSNSEGSPDANRSSFDDYKNVEKSKMSAEERADMLSKRAAERDNIPPLKLIDTGNPEADAEANRVAIEEDKRRRNTAASARFRMKKKQREAALETHTKELQDQMQELRDELEKLRNENQWLKGLIQVRSGSEEEKRLKGLNGVESSNAKSSPSTSSKDGNSVEAFQAAQQLQALHHAVSSQKNAQSKALQAHLGLNGSRSPDSQNERLRDTGIRPRGVGTQTNLPEKRDRED